MTSVNCIINQQCDTGFCQDGVCQKPGPKEPCKKGTCPNNYTCHENHKVCIGASEVGKFDSEIGRKRGLCDNSNAECGPPSYCKMRFSASGLCELRIQPGEKCTQIDSCIDGYVCYGKKCMAKCDKSGKSNFKCADGAACQQNAALSSAKLGVCPEKPTEVVKPSPIEEPELETVIVGEEPTRGEGQVTPREGEISGEESGETFGETPGEESGEISGDERGEGEPEEEPEEEPGMYTPPGKAGSVRPVSGADPLLQKFKKNSHSHVSPEEWQEMFPNIDVEALNNAEPGIRPETIIDMVREPSLTPEVLVPVIKDVKPEEVRPDLTPSYKAWAAYIAAKANQQVGKFSKWRPTRNQAIFGGVGLLGLLIFFVVLIRYLCCRRKRQEAGSYTAPHTTYQTSRRF